MQYFAKDETISFQTCVSAHEKMAAFAIFTSNPVSLLMSSLPPQILDLPCGPVCVPLQQCRKTRKLFFCTIILLHAFSMARVLSAGVRRAALLFLQDVSAVNNH